MKPNATEYWWISHKLDPGRPMLIQVIKEDDELYITSPGNENKGPIDGVLEWVELVRPPYQNYKALETKTD